MTSLLAILTGAVLVNHFVLVRYPALWPDGQAPARSGMPAPATLATVVAATLASVLIRLPDAYALPWPAWRELRLPVLVLVTAAAVPAAAFPIRLVCRMTRESLAPWLPLVMFNSLTVAVAVLATRQQATAAAAGAWAAGAAITFSALLVVFADIRGRLDAGDLPASLRGAAIGLLTAGMISLAFSGLASVVRG